MSHCLCRGSYTPRCRSVNSSTSLHLQSDIAMWAPTLIRLFLIVAFGIGGLSNCSILDPDICTVRGCGSDPGEGLTVRLASLPTGAYSVEVFTHRTTGSQLPSYIYECDGQSSCRAYPAESAFVARIDEQQIHFQDVFSSRVDIKVTTVAGSRITEFRNVEYAKAWPNGRRCPPPCLHATVVVELPV